MTRVVCRAKDKLFHVDSIIFFHISYSFPRSAQVPEVNEVFHPIYFTENHVVILECRFGCWCDCSQDLEAILVLPDLNDTGSSTLTFHMGDIPAMGFVPGPNVMDRSFRGFIPQVQMSTSAGQGMRYGLVVECQVVKIDLTPLTPWYWELATIYSSNTPTNVPRLSGQNMRRMLYFGTA